MLRRPGGRPMSGPVPSSTFGHAVVDAAVDAAEHEQVARAQDDVGERARAAVDAGQPEHARVTEADRHDRRVGRLLAVLVQAEAGAGRVEVDDRRVGRVAIAGRGAERVGDGPARQVGEVGRQRLHRCAVGVVGRAAVGVGLPVPAEADRLHGHQVAGRHAWVAQSGRRHGPAPEVGDERPLAVEVEPAADVDDVVEQLGALPSPARVRRGRARAGRTGACPAVAARSARRRGGWCPSGCGSRSWSHRVNAARRADVRFSRFSRRSANRAPRSRRSGRAPPISTLRTQRRPLQRALVTGLGRRPHDRRHVADEQGAAEGEHEPRQQVVAEEHAPRMAAALPPSHRCSAHTPAGAALSKRVYWPR